MDWYNVHMKGENHQSMPGRNTEIEDTLPEELKILIDEFEEARRTGEHFDSKAMSLECELRSMEKDGVISKEQADWVKDEHLYGNFH